MLIVNRSITLIDGDGSAVVSDLTRPAADEVLLWQFPLGGEGLSASRFINHLSPEEKDRAERFRFERDRTRFVVARGMLREILGGCTDTKPREIRFRVNGFGKPFLESIDDPLRFNLSHSKDLALLAVTSGREVGVDIEWVDYELDVLSTAPTVFSKTEVEELARLDCESRTRAFFRGWTRKEAYLKAIGEGFSGLSREVPISFVSRDAAVFIDEEGTETCHWSLATLLDCSRICAAVVAEASAEEGLIPYESNGKAGYELADC